MGSDTLKALQVWLPSLTPLVIGLLTVYIAAQQWRTNHLKVKLDLYDRRLAVYIALIEFLAYQMGDRAEGFGKSIEFVQKTRESYFLFGKRMADYLHEVYKKSVELDTVVSRLRDGNLAGGDERNRLINQRGELSLWFGDQVPIAQKRFSEYMALG